MSKWTLQTLEIPAFRKYSLLRAAQSSPDTLLCFLNSSLKDIFVDRVALPLAYDVAETIRSELSTWLLIECTALSSKVIEFIFNFLSCSSVTVYDLSET